MSEKWIPGGRKFFLALLTLLLTSILLAYGKLPDGSYTTIVIGIVGLYIGGNVAQDYRPPRTPK